MSEFRKLLIAYNKGGWTLREVLEWTLANPLVIIPLSLANLIGGIIGFFFFIPHITVLQASYGFVGITMAIFVPDSPIFAIGYSLVLLLPLISKMKEHPLLDAIVCVGLVKSATLYFVFIIIFNLFATYEPVVGFTAILHGILLLQGLSLLPRLQASLQGRFTIQQTGFFWLLMLLQESSDIFTETLRF